jgi:hypothetical protein
MLLGLLAHGRDGSITPRQAQTGHMRATSAAAAASWAKSWLSWVQQQIWCYCLPEMHAKGYNRARNDWKTCQA